MLFNKLQQFIDPEEDRLKMYTLCQGCRKKIVSTGKENDYDFEDKYIIV